ncbi:MAG: carboxypeptidase-like regulatory domain-containing protein [Chitinophagaceae bacterium]|nr:MAG: carboxypeptidase-like regulatory domain-containing protein [Chitinophagaceae bacterium]
MSDIKQFIIYTFFTLFFLFTAFDAFSQQIVVSGRVIDDHTEEAIPFAHVHIKGTPAGTYTDMDGYFELQSSVRGDSVIATTIGYQKQAITIERALAGNVTIRMFRSDFNIEEVVVRAGENPAHIILRKIIENKPRHNKDNLENYKYEVYNKIELDLTNITENFKNRRIFRQVDFIFDNIDSLSEEKPFLPIFITETISEYAKRTSPTRERERILASKVSGSQNESITQFLGSMYQDINIYNNWVDILNRSFVSPIANQGLSYYNYFLVDSAYIDDVWSFQIHFKPKYRGSSTFVGEFWVADSSFAINRISMQISDDANINFVDRLSIYQNFKPLDDGSWMIHLDRLFVDFVRTSEDALGIIGRKTTSYKNIEINIEDIDRYLAGREEVIIDEQAMQRDESFWEENRHLSLTKNEAAVYKMIDSLKNVPMIRTYVDIVNALATGYYALGPVEIGPYFSFYGYNEVEGHRFLMGLRTSNDFSKNIMFGGYAAYGTKDKRIKYGGSLLWLLEKSPRMSIGAMFRDDVSLSTDNRDGFGTDNIFAYFLRRDIPLKLVNIREGRAFYEKEWPIGYSQRVGVGHREIEPYFDFTYLNGEAAAASDTFLNKITTTEITLKSRFAYREKFVSGQFQRLSLGSQYPILQLQYTYGVPNVLNSNFSYHKLVGDLSHTFRLNPIGRMHMNLTFGKVFGDLPYLLLEVHEGNEGYFFNSRSYNLMNNYQFASDQFVGLYLSHHFEGLFFNRIPGVRNLKFREVIHAKALLGSMSEENRFLNRFNEVYSPSPTPYIEAGVGIENILKFFRVDAIWRLTYRDLPDTSPFGVRVGMQLSF